ncbi:MAG: alpha/beta family hydrolase [Bauldia sp.]
MAGKALTIDAGSQPVSALWLEPKGSDRALVLAHGAGGGMRQRFLEATANGLADRGIATLRFQFPYMEAGRARPDTPAVATAAVRAAVAKAGELAPDLALFAGGKSFGGRMTSTAQSEAALPGVRGLVFLGFPLHPPGKPSDDRAAHLGAVDVPMLFLQGSRDDFARLDLLEPLVARLKPRATLALYEGANHSFHVPKASGRTDADILNDVLDEIARWTDRIAGE